MKDAVHHLKHTQKKVIRSARGSSGSSKSMAYEKKSSLQNGIDLTPGQIYEKRADTNHRVPRLRNNRSFIH